MSFAKELVNSDFYSIILISHVLIESRGTCPTGPRAPRIYFTSAGMATLHTVGQGNLSATRAREWEARWRWLVSAAQASTYRHASPESSNLLSSLLSSLLSDIYLVSVWSLSGLYLISVWSSVICAVSLSNPVTPCHIVLSQRSSGRKMGSEWEGVQDLASHSL